MGCALRSGNRVCAELVRGGGSPLGGVGGGVSASLTPWGDAPTASLAVGQRCGVAEACKRVLQLGPPPVSRSALRQGLGASPARSASRPSDGQKRVRFDLERNTVHAVRPYAEVYGLHPREFVFERGGFLVVPICKPPDAHEADEDGEGERADRAADVDDDGWLLVG